VADGTQSPYAASLIGNMRHWLDDDPEIIDIMAKLPAINRKDIIT